jgi:hypothetical protein
MGSYNEYGGYVESGSSSDFLGKGVYSTYQEYLNNKYKQEDAALKKKQYEDKLAWDKQQAALEAARIKQSQDYQEKMVKQAKANQTAYMKEVAKMNERTLKNQSSIAADQASILKQNLAEQSAKAQTLNLPQGSSTTANGTTTVTESPEQKQIRMLLEARQQKLISETGDMDTKAYEDALRTKYDPGLQSITKQFQGLGTSGSSMEAYAKAKYLANRDTEVALNANTLKNQDVASKTAQLGQVGSLLSQGYQQNYGLGNLTSAQALTTEQNSTQTELEKLKLAQQAQQFSQSQAQQQTQFTAQLGQNAMDQYLKTISMFYR